MITAAALFVVLLLVALAGWGLRSVTGPESYFAASRVAGPILAGLGGTAAGLSAFVFVGGPGLFASLGSASLWIVLSAPLTGALQCWLVGEPIVDSARRCHTVTVPGLLADRFGEGAPRLLSAAAILLGAAAMVALQARAAALLAPPLLGVPGWTAALVITIVTTTYTWAGGMRIGLPLEAVQGLIMGVAALLVAVAALAAAGGPATAYHILATSRPELLSAWGKIGPTRSLGWLLLFGIGTCAQPHYLQKFLLLRDRASLRWLPLVGTLSLAAVLLVWVGIGLGGMALVTSGSLRMGSPDGLTPAILAASLPPWATWAAAAAIAAAVMSTTTSLLNLAAAAVSWDVPRALGRPAGSVGAARRATLLVAGAALALGLAWPRALALLGVLGWGTFTASLLPAIALGLNWKGATRAGAVVALAVGPLVQLTLELARPSLPGLSAWEPGLTGAALGTILMVALSRKGEST